MHWWSPKTDYLLNQFNLYNYYDYLVLFLLNTKYQHNDKLITCHKLGMSIT